jgi:hypothetical protein
VALSSNCANPWQLYAREALIEVVMSISSYIFVRLFDNADFSYKYVRV